MKQQPLNKVDFIYHVISESVDYVDTHRFCHVVDGEVRIYDMDQYLNALVESCYTGAYVNDDDMTSHGWNNYDEFRAVVRVICRQPFVIDLFKAAHMGRDDEE